jgi:hypothetical protein
MTQISCVYSRTATGRLALIFAADLWSKLHGAEAPTTNGAKHTAQVGAVKVGPAQDQPLHVYSAQRPRRRRLDRRGAQPTP